MQAMIRAMDTLKIPYKYEHNKVRFLFISIAQVFPLFISVNIVKVFKNCVSHTNYTQSYEKGVILQSYLWLSILCAVLTTQSCCWLHESHS